MRRSGNRWWLLIAAAAIGPSGSVAEARSVSAFLGHPENPNDYSCFTNANGRISNVCYSSNQPKRYCVALPVDSSGEYIVQVTASAPDAEHGLSCFSRAMDRHAMSSWGSTNRPLTSFGSPQVIQMTYNKVPSFGVLYACCDMLPGSSISTINWEK
jgi:hypothetical protein